MKQIQITCKNCDRPLVPVTNASYINYYQCNKCLLLFKAENVFPLQDKDYSLVKFWEIDGKYIPNIAGIQESGQILFKDYKLSGKPVNIYIKRSGKYVTIYTIVAIPDLKRNFLKKRLSNIKNVSFDF